MSPFSIFSLPNFRYLIIYWTFISATSSFLSLSFFAFSPFSIFLFFLFPSLFTPYFQFHMTSQLTSCLSYYFYSFCSSFFPLSPFVSFPFLLFYDRILYLAFPPPHFLPFTVDHVDYTIVTYEIPSVQIKLRKWTGKKHGHEWPTRGTKNKTQLKLWSKRKLWKWNNVRPESWQKII